MFDSVYAPLDDGSKQNISFLGDCSECSECTTNKKEMFVVLVTAVSNCLDACCRDCINRRWGLY